MSDIGALPAGIEAQSRLASQNILLVEREIVAARADNA
jgi:hypothetical protein